MRAAEISRALSGARASGGFLVRCPVSSHGKGRGDRMPSLLLSDGERALVVKCFSGCDPRDVLAELRCRGLLDQREMSRCRATPSPVTKTSRAPVGLCAAERRRLAVAMWGEARNPRSSIVESYLASRGLELGDDVAGAVLRYHPQCPFKLKDGSMARLPAMLALMRDIRTDEPVAVHRTALRADGSGKAEMPDSSNPRKMLAPAEGAAIKLDADAEVVGGLAVGEGIETCLSARAMGFAPIWALGAAGAVGRLLVLAGVEALTILQENDRTSTRASAACAERWHRAGREVTVLRSHIGSDFNDILRAAA